MLFLPAASWTLQHPAPIRGWESRPCELRIESPAPPSPPSRVITGVGWRDDQGGAWSVRWQPSGKGFKEWVKGPDGTDMESGLTWDPEVEGSPFLRSDSLRAWGNGTWQVYDLAIGTGRNGLPCAAHILVFVHKASGAWTTTAGVEDGEGGISIRGQQQLQVSYLVRWKTVVKVGRIVGYRFRRAGWRVSFREKRVITRPR